MDHGNFVFHARVNSILYQTRRAIMRRSVNADVEILSEVQNMIFLCLIYLIYLMFIKPVIGLLRQIIYWMISSN